MTRTIGWALTGPGRHADRNVAPQLRHAAGTKLVTVVSRDRARGEAFAQKHGFAKAYASLDEALRDPEVEAIYHATPDGLHARDVLAAVEAGKHSLVEKPLALTLAEGRRMIEASERRGTKLAVVMNQRHEAVHQEARRQIQAGELGEVAFARVQVALRVASASPPPGGGNWRADRAMRSGGNLMSIGDHAYDTLAYILGQDIVEVSAFTDASAPDARDERAASMLLKLSGGAVGYAVSSGRTPFARGAVEIHGTKASLVLRNTYAYLTGAGEDPRPSLERIDASGSTLRHFDETPSFRLEVEQFMRHIQGDGEPMTPAREALRAMAVTEALYASARTGKVEKVAGFMSALLQE